MTDIHILRIPHPSLPQFPRLSELVALINTAFYTSWATIPGLVGPDALRYDHPEDFPREMGDAGVTWVAFEKASGSPETSEKEGRIVATAGYKGWGKWKVLERMEVRGIEEAPPVEHTTEADVDSAKFELVVVVVDPSIQKSGLGSRMSGIVEAELKEKVRAMGKKQLKLMVRAGKETIGEYWTRKGYRTVGEEFFAPGNFGSKTGFTVSEMERVIEV